MNFTHQPVHPCIVLFLSLAVLTCGCISSSGSSDTPAAVSGSDSSGFYSGFEEVAGTYTSVENPASSIILKRDGMAEISTEYGMVSSSFYMESGVLRLEDGTSIGAYPIVDGTLTYKGMNFRK